MVQRQSTSNDGTHRVPNRDDAGHGDAQLSYGFAKVLGNTYYTGIMAGVWGQPAPCHTVLDWKIHYGRHAGTRECAVPVPSGVLTNPEYQMPNR